MHNQAVRQTPCPPASLASRCSWIGALAVLLALPALGDYEAGLTAYHEGRYEEAAEEMRAVIRSTPDYAPAHYLLGLCRLVERKPHQAVKSLLEAHRLSPEQPDYIVRLAHAHVLAGTHLEALLTLEKLDLAAVTDEQRNSYVAIIRAATAHLPDRHRALETLVRAAESLPEEPELRLGLAAELRHQNDLQGAALALRAAYTLRPGLELGLTALRALLAAAELEPGAASALLKAAGELSEELVAGHPRVTTHTLRGETLFRLGEVEAARQQLRSALALEGPKAPLHHRLGRWAVQLGDLEGAKQELLTALALADKERAGAEGSTLGRAIAASLARVHHSLEEYGAAAVAYDRAGSPELAEAMRNAAIAIAEAARQRQICLDLQRQTAEMEAYAADLTGTPYWQKLQEEICRILEPCREILGLDPD